MLSKQDLEAIGYQVNPDPDQPGKFYWRHDHDGSDVSYDSEAAALLSAAADARNTYELHRCDNCGKVHSEETLVEVRHQSMRVSPGGMAPSGQCVDCGALCFPLEEDPDWDLVKAFFGLDDSFCYTAEQVIEYTNLYSQAEANSIRVPRDVLAALVKMAGNHVQDIESGIEDGTYSAEDNQDLSSKQASFNTASVILRNATRGAQPESNG